MNDSELREILDTIPEEIRVFTKYIVQLSESISHALKELGWQKKDLAKRANMKESQLSRYLNGTANPNLKTVARISAALGRELIQFPEFERLRKGQTLSSSTSVRTDGTLEIPETTGHTWTTDHLAWESETTSKSVESEN